MYITHLHLLQKSPSLHKLFSDMRSHDCPNSLHTTTVKTYHHPLRCMAHMSGGHSTNLHIQYIHTFPRHRSTGCCCSLCLKSNGEEQAWKVLSEQFLYVRFPLPRVLPGYSQDEDLIGCGLMHEETLPYHPKLRQGGKQYHTIYDCCYCVMRIL